MVKYIDDQLDLVFNALSDRTRRAILARLSKGEALVTELAEPFDISLPAISKHLGVLQRAGLIDKHKDGRIRRCQLNAEPLKDAAQWIEFYRQFWEHQLDSLSQFLENMENKENTHGPGKSRE